MRTEPYNPTRAGTWCLLVAVAVNLAAWAWAALILTGRVG